MFTNLLKRDQTDNHYFRPVIVGGFTLSIQASESHYCTPRTWNDNPNFYTSFEVAIFEGDEWINPIEDKRFSDLFVLNRYFSRNDTSNGGFVPKELVNVIYERCKQLSK